MLLRLPEDEDLSEFDKGFIKVYNQKNSEKCFLEVDIQYPDELHELYNDLLFLTERMKIEKAKKLVANFHYKKESVIHMRSLKQALNYGLVLKNVHLVNNFNQKAWLKPYIHMNPKLRKKTKMTLSKAISS